jgi:hypothetical protein
MINNPELSFSIETFVESLTSLQQQGALEETKLPLVQAMETGKFIRADVGVFRKNDDHSIWKLEKDEDGKEFITRTGGFAVVTASDWSATSNRVGDVVTLAYKNYPIRKFARSEFAFDNANNFASFLVQKANSNNKKFASGVIKTLSFEARLELQRKFALFREV